MIAAGLSLREICARPRIKARTSKTRVLSWSIDPNHEFSDQYLRARAVSYHLMAQEIVEIVDDGTNDWMKRRNKDGEETDVLNQEHIARTRLRYDARRWFLSKVLPKTYGDKVLNEITGPNGGPIQTQDVNPQATGEDHLAHLARRYGGASRRLTVIDGGKAKSA
jgi:hypothetical protein